MRLRCGDEFFDNVTTSRPVHTSTDVEGTSEGDETYDEEDVNTVIVPSFHPFNQSFLQNVPISLERKKMYVVLERESHFHRELYVTSLVRYEAVEQHTNQRNAPLNVFCVVAENSQD